MLSVVRRAVWCNIVILDSWNEYKRQGDIGNIFIIQDCMKSSSDKRKLSLGSEHFKRCLNKNLKNGNEREEGYWICEGWLKETSSTNNLTF